MSPTVLSGLALDCKHRRRDGLRYCDGARSAIQHLLVGDGQLRAFLPLLFSGRRRCGKLLHCLYGFTNQGRVDAGVGFLGNRLAVANAAAAHVAERFVGVGPQALQCGPDLDLGATSRYSKPEVHSTIAGVRDIAQIMDDRVGGTEVRGDLTDRLGLLAEQQIRLDPDTGEVLDGIELQRRLASELFDEGVLGFRAGVDHQVGR